MGGSPQFDVVDGKVAMSKMQAQGRTAPAQGPPIAGCSWQVWKAESDRERYRLTMEREKGFEPPPPCCVDFGAMLGFSIAWPSEPCGLIIEAHVNADRT
jgi:hypothetical protein